MLNVFDVADALVEDVKKRFAASVAIVAYYGSYANGTATPRSDLDFFFIPDGPGASAASLQFIIDGIGFDFWPISWTRAERIADFDEAIVSVIADCRVLYSRSAADLGRFEALKRKTESMSLPENRGLMLGKAKSLFKEGYVHLFEVTQAARQGRLPQARRHAARLASVTAQCLALLNQTYFKKGMGQNMAEVMALRLKPEGMEDLLRAVSSSASCSEIQAACETLVERTALLLRAEEAALREPVPFASVFNGFHEEALSTYNKIKTACERGDREMAFYASLNLQEELESALRLCEGEGSYRRLCLPDLTAEFDSSNLSAFRETVAKLEAQFRGILKSRGVTLNEFTSLEEFREFVRNR